MESIRKLNEIFAHDDFACVFSIPVKFQIYFLGRHKKLSLVLL